MELQVAGRFGQYVWNIYVTAQQVLSPVIME